MPRPTADRYTAEPLPQQTASTQAAGGESQRFDLGRDLPGEWWTLFGSARLDALIAEALTSYPDIAAQQAALREARENVRAGEGPLLPQFQGSAWAERQQESGAEIFPGFPSFITNIFYTTVNVSYTFDIFGKQRRTVEGLRAQAVQQNFELEASYLTLAANVASTAVQIASTHDQIAATNEIISVEQKQLDLIKHRAQLGSLTRSDILQQQSNLDSVRATLPPLRQQLAAAEHSLAVLTGHFPRDMQALELALTDLHLPRELPVSLPSSLVAQRPDIRAQAAVVHQASADIGVATANMLPQLTLTGSFGNATTTVATLIDSSSGIWSIGGPAGGLAAPLFEGGTLRAKRRAAIDAYDQALAQYRLRLLQAFQNVADTLTALDNDARALAAEHDALDSARASLDLVQRQYDLGAVNYVSLLTAEQTYQQARLGYVRALASRYTDTVTLFQALGGGWWHRHDAGTMPGLAGDVRQTRNPS
jgi:NodT family efflux transporter outer membrane factor (OMF) lipoprotein